MDRQQIGLKLALDALGQGVSLSDFDSRLILQKTIYLAQAAQVDLGYSFSWYLKGPYSPGLTRDAFALKAELAQSADDLSGWKLDSTSVERLSRLRGVIHSIPDSTRARRLELLASVHFLLRTRQASSSDVAGVRDILRRNQKFYSELEIRQAIEELKSHGLFPAPGA